MVIRSANGREFKNDFSELCHRHQIKQEVITVDSLQFNGVAERALGTIEMTQQMACI